VGSASVLNSLRIPLEEGRSGSTPRRADASRGRGSARRGTGRRERELERAAPSARVDLQVSDGSSFGLAVARQGAGVGVGAPNV
jgi:hypothetical protein